MVLGASTSVLRAVQGLIVLVISSLFATAMPSVAGAADDPPAVLGGQLFSTGAPVTVEVLPASAGLTSVLFLLEPEAVQIATNRDVGTTTTVGPYGSGTELVFGIRVGGQEFRVGPGARNPDGLAHAVVDFDAAGCAVVGFEDLFGGGDRDYDDNRFKFCGGVAPDVPEDPEDPPTPDPVAAPIADAGPDQAVDEGSTVTLDGSGSKASTKPALQGSEERGALPGGTSLGAALDELEGEPGALKVSGAVDVGQGAAAQNTSIAYVVDVSGSAGGRGGPCGNVNGDRASDTILDCELAAALKLHEEVSASGTVDKVALVTFSSGASAVDLDPTSAVATLVAPTADADNNGVVDIVQAIKRVTGSGGTNFIPPVSTSCKLLATTGSPNLVTAFMSDGQGAGSLKSVLPCDPPVTFHSFAVGSGSRCDAGSAVGSRLIDMATLSGGTCTNVPVVSDLPDILPKVISSRITKVTYTIDGGEPVDISGSLDLPKDGPTTLDVSFDLPADLARGQHRICLTVTGEDSGGTSSETTCSDLVTVTGEVTYSWRQLSRSGPPVFLSARTSAHPSFVAPDDGRYVFELTVTDGTGGTATDQVVVEARNVAPSLTLAHGDSFAGGVTQVNATLTDVGWLDSHAATVEWGDGTTDTVDVTTAGPGWGTFFGSHVYRTAGTFDVVVTLTDDDGGVAVQRVDHLEVATPAAIWANSVASPSLNWSGGSGEIQGRVHTNGQLRFVGAAKSVRGETTYAGSLAADTTKNSFLPLPVRTAVQEFPFHPDVADFRPGGPVATEVGSAYHDMTTVCADGSWHEVQSVLDSGVYYAPCDIQLNGSDIGGRVTLVSEGRVKVSGSRPAFQPYRDGLLVLAGAQGPRAIDVSTSSSKFLGVLFAGSGEISVSGAGNRFYCGILGDTISITGTDVSVRGADCGRPASTVSGPVVVPDLAAAIEVDRADALPSDELGYDLTVTNRGTTLVVPSLIGLENVDTATATIRDHEFVVERRDAATGQWVPVASAGDPSMQLNLRPNASPGVTYADSGVVGTTVAPGGWATWGLQAVLTLTPEQVTELLDESRTSGMRTRVDFLLDPSTVQARRLYTYGTDFSAALRELGADVVDASLTAILPDGEATVLPASDTDPQAGLAPGESVTLHRTWTVPVPATRAATETDAGYLSRLQALDGTSLNGALFVTAKGGVGRLVAPLDRVETRRRVPVVAVSTVGAEGVAAGSTADYDLKLANVGSTGASHLEVAATADTAPLTVAGSPADLAAGELATARTTYTAPPGSSGTLALRGTARWEDDRGNTYGSTGSTLSVVRQLPAALVASLDDSLVTDVDNDAAVSPGDTVRYTLTVRNRGGQPLTGVTGSLPVPAHTTVIAGALSTPDGGSAQLADGVVSFALPDIAGGTTRRVVIDVVVAKPFPEGVSRLQAQATVDAAHLDEVRSDDPALPGSADPTRTTVTRPQPALIAALTGQLAVDADGSGTVTPGDTLAYSLGISSVGNKQVSGIRATVATPAATSLVEGSVRTTTGTVGAGPGVDVTVGTLAPFQSATVEFRARIDAPLPTGVLTISAAGTVTSDQLEPIHTDDPQTVDVGDGTSIPIGGDGGSTDVPIASVSGLEPADGARVATPTDLSATVTAPNGGSIATWRVEMVPAHGGDATVLATGLGSGASVDVAARIDPTLLENGLYVVRIVTVTSGGARSVNTSTVVVDGGFKPGRLTTSFLDHQVGLGGLPLQVVRSYDSFDTAAGDFGVGWKVDVADFRIARAKPLGQGGWSGRSTTCGLIFCNLEYTSSTPHIVSVVWPDGHQEVFDLKGVDGSTFFPGLARAKFVPRSGTDTTSTLEVVGDDSVFFSGGDLRAGFFGSDGIFDPSVFRLTDRNGVEYVIDRATGLQTVKDRAGNTLTFTRDGVKSSLGKDIAYTRDTQDRITKIISPAGTTSYGYDHGDLVSSTDLAGAVTRYEYDGAHNLTNVIGSGGVSLGRSEYDAAGRLVAWIDGEGNRTEIGTDLGANQERITSADGRKTTISTFDDSGRMVRVNEVYGGTDHVSTLRHDGRGNVTSRVDPLGHEWKGTYDAAGRLTSFTDPEGNTSRISYTERGEPATLTAADGSSMRYVWDASNGTLRSRTDAAGNAESYTYGPSGLMTSRTDAAGKTTRWTYTPTGLLASEVDPLGNESTWEYDSAGRVVTSTAPGGAVTRKTYDARGNVTSETDPDGRITRWTYDDLSQMVRETGPGGLVTDYTYDASGRPVGVDNHVQAPVRSTFDPMGRLLTRKVGDSVVARLRWDGGGNVLERVDALGNTTTYTYDALGRQLTETNPAGGIATTSYTPAGRVAKTVTAWGGVTTLAYDSAGRVVRRTDPAGEVWRTEYDELGRPVKQFSPDGTSAESRYDSLGRLVASVDQLGAVTRYEYDVAGRPTAVVDAEGRRTETTYDAAGRAVKVVGPDHEAWQTRYTPGGLIEEQIAPSGGTTRYDYDSAGRQVRMTDPEGHAWSTTYDALGRVVAERGPRQQGAGPATLAHTYDARGMLTATADALGNVVRFDYDANGNRTAVTDARGNTWTTTYDALGHPVKTADPLGRATVRAYDRAGRLTRTTDPRGQTTLTEYDPAGRVAVLGEVGGPGRIAFGYDVMSRRTSMTDATGTTRTSFTLTGLPSQVSSPQGAVGYEYDLTGLVTQRTQPEGVTHYSYDAAGREREVIGVDGRTRTTTYTADGQVDKVTRPSGIVSDWTYDRAGRTTGVVHGRSGGAVVDSAAYTLDADGNRTSKTTPSGTWSYKIDAIGQLTEQTGPGGVTTRWTYDPAGNRLSQTVEGGARVAYSYDAAGQLVTAGDHDITHDDAGNMIGRTGPGGAGATYTWDWRGRLTKVSTETAAGASSESGFSYNGDGLRVSERTTRDGSTQTVDKLYDTTTGVPRLIGNGGATYGYDAVGNLADITSGARSDVLTDIQGSVTAVADGSGEVIGRADYDAFGGMSTRSGDVSPMGYTGAPQSESGLVHLLARDYDPGLGRFLSVDPVRPGAAGVVGWNTYTYVGNNPTTATDPTGQTAFVERAIIGWGSLAVAEQALVLGASVALLYATTHAWVQCLTYGCTAYPDLDWTWPGRRHPEADADVDWFRIRNSMIKAAVAAGVTTVAAGEIARACIAHANAGRLATSVCDRDQDRTPIWVVGGMDLPDHQSHILRAITRGMKPMLLHRKQPPWPRNGWYNREPECSGRPSGMACDEYPFASALEGGKGNRPSLQPVDLGESSRQGSLLGGFYGTCAVSDGQEFVVLPVPGVPTVGVCGG